MISFTTDESIARQQFANGGPLYKAVVDPADLIWTNHAGGESEVLVRNMIKAVKWK